ncbi:hypothetical protein MTBSS4_640003 [Magnetospirillum sp. SS-4]|jgi:hypothetical protein|nr:hypothetical protein MTBSS4_640003 [Magnetospirillum sp. SS-4]
MARYLLMARQTLSGEINVFNLGLRVAFVASIYIFQEIQA